MEGISLRRGSPAAKRRNCSCRRGHDCHWPRAALSRGKFPISPLVVRCGAALGFAGLSRACPRKTDRGESYGVAAPGRRSLRSVPQQEARRISALQDRGLEFTADRFVGSDLPRAESLSKREIQDMFIRFRTIKSFVSRDQ